MRSQSAFAIVLGLLLGVPAPAVLAAAGEGYLEEVVVTARKREEFSQDIPLAVSVFGEAELDQRKVLDIEDLESLVPNLVIDPISFQSNAAAVFIRGLGVQDIDRTFNPAVQVVINNVTYGSSIANTMLNVIDIDRIEVLRGPQGTLFGANAIGGVINVTRRLPTGEFGFDLEGTFGTWDRRDFEAAISTPTYGDLISGRLFVAKFDNDGPFHNNFDGNSRGGDDRLLISPQILLTPTEDFEVLLTYDYYRDESDWGIAVNRSNEQELLCLGAVFFPGDPKCFDETADLTDVDLNFPTFLRVETQTASVWAKYEGEKLMLESITGYSRTQEDKQTDFDSIPDDLFASVQPVNEDYVSQEFRIDYNHNDKLNVFAGLFGAYNEYVEDVNSLFIFARLGFPPGTVEVVNRQQETLTFGAFLNVNYQVTDKLTLSVGGRHSWEKKEFIYRNGFNQSGGFWPDAEGVTNIAPGEESWTEFTPRVAVEYQLKDDVLVYLSYAQGFKSGGFNGRGNNLDSIGPYDPEIVDSFELGMKSDWFDNRMRLNLVGFYSEFTDKQEEIIRVDPGNGATITRVENAGEATIQGLEAEWTLAPRPNMTISATAGWLDTEYDEFVTAGFDVAGFVDLRRAPEFQYSLTGTYDKRFGDTLVSSLVTYRWTDEYQTHLGPRFDGGGPAPFINDPRGLVDGFGTLDASIGFDVDINETKVGVMFFGRNLTDEVFLAGVAPIANLWAQGGVFPGRFWGVELRAGM